MTRRRWIADEVRGDTAALTGDHAAHLSRVLRAQVGQEFDIATGNAIRRGKITFVSENRVEFALDAELPAKPLPKLTLLLAIFKFDRMEWAIEKCTEIGVTKIVPLAARRTDSHLATAAIKRHERWQRIVLQASEQARRSAPPEITSPMQLKELTEYTVSAESVSRVVLSESEEDTRLGDVLPSSSREIVLAIGPEGGWTDDELAWFRQSGWETASLGNNILRAETAAIVATALALDALR
jgi:16S rRNA (uracil1498-N3)-methyltransferase